MTTRTDQATSLTGLATVDASLGAGEAGQRTTRVKHDPDDGRGRRWRGGIRRLAMDLAPDALERVHAKNLQWMATNDISSVEFGVIYCRARK